MRMKFRHGPIQPENCRAVVGSHFTVSLHGLNALTNEYLLSIASGDLLLLGGRWYVTHRGLLGLAHRHRCAGIHMRPICRSSVILPLTGGHSRPRCTNREAVEVSSDWRCRPIQCLSAGPRRGDASGGDSSCQPGTSQGLRYRLVLCRRTWLANRPASNEPTKLPPQPSGGSGSEGRKSPRPPLPGHSPASARPKLGEGLCQSNSAVSKPSKTPLASKSKPSSKSFPIGQREIAMPCSASSIAIWAAKKVPHETSDPRNPGLSSVGM